MNINVLLMVSSLFYLLLIAILYFSKSRINSFETKIYKYILILAIFGVILDMLGLYFSINIKDDNVNRWIVLKFYYSYLLTMIYLLSLYLMIFSNSSGLTGENKKKFWMFSIIYLIFLGVNFILPVKYFKEGNIVYAYGLNTNFLYLVAGITIFLWLIYLIYNIKLIKIKKNLPVISFMVMIAPVIYLQMANPELLLVSGLISFVVVMMYHTIENPDVKIIAELEAAKDQADKANSAKSDFLSSMSHEIRTPLNAIVGFSECINDADNLDEAKENARDVISASNTLLEIVNGILDISKIEAGKIEIINTDYDSKELFEGIRRLAVARLGSKELDFRVNISEDLPPVLYGDHSNIKKVVINLLTNAIKYTDSGYVDFRVGCVITGEICRLVVSVEDSGRGIKKEHIDKLFSKFQRLDEDKNTTIEGTGLGLAITKQLVELMGGKIIVQTIYGEGSKFTVAIDQRIEFKPKEEVIVKKVSTKHTLDLSDKKILIVDDNQLNLKIASKILAIYKPNIEICSSGQECINLIKNGNKFDMILMDDMMPKMSGVEALAILKQIPDFKVPTIALTANAISGIKEKYLSLGFDDYLSKPIDREELFNVITKHINGVDVIEIKEDVKPIEVEEDVPGLASISTFASVVPMGAKIEQLDLDGKNILIVDDNSLNIKIAKMFLKPYNANVTSVTSGNECIDKINNHIKYDLIFMDDMMPVINGVETFHKIKDTFDFDTPVVALTANAVTGSREYYLNEGFSDYLSKPIDKNEFDRVLRTHIKIKK